MLILAKTEFDSVIGAFTPLSIKKGYGGHQSDKKGFTFLFSLTNEDKYSLTNNKKAFEITPIGSGPSFGDKDFSIGNNASTMQTSRFDLGNTFQIPEKYESKQEAIKSFIGAKGNEKQVNSMIRLKEWEVFQVY
mgnify:CR=1 FL=1